MTLNSKYWEGRAKALSSTIWRNTDKVNKELEKIYKQSAKEIQQELGEWLSKYQSNHGLDAESMKKIMNTKEAADFRYTVKGYMEKIEELGASKEAKELLKEFDIMAGRVRFQRYEELYAQMQYQATKLSQITQSTIQKQLEGVISEGYNRSIFDVQQGLGLSFSFNHINSDTIESIINTPWNGKLFSSRIWDNKVLLTNNLRRIITGGVMQGQEFERMSQQLQKEMGTSFFRARRILETETTYALGRAKEESYKELGIENYKVIAVLDKVTSEVCQQLDGKIFRVKDRVSGVNASPMHPFCRTTEVPYVSTLKDVRRIARDSDTGKNYYVPADMNYEEWLKNNTNKGIIEISRKEEKTLDIFSTQNQKTIEKMTYEVRYGNLKNLKIEDKDMEMLRDFKVKNKEFVDTLPEEQKEALRKYTASNFEEMNKILRYGEEKCLELMRKEQLEYNQNLIKEMDKIYTNAPKAGINFNVLRGEKILREQKKYFEDLLISKAGDVKRFDGYTSTSLLEKKAYEFLGEKGKRVLWDIEIDRTKKLLDVNSISSVYNESEVLLNRGSKVLIKTIEIDGEFIKVSAKLL